MRRLRVIDVREHGGPGLPQPGLKVIGGLRHRMLARPCHEPIIRGAGGGRSWYRDIGVGMGGVGGASPEVTTDTGKDSSTPLTISLGPH